MKRFSIALILLASSYAGAQDGSQSEAVASTKLPGARSLILQSCPALELTSYEWDLKEDRISERCRRYFGWKNTSEREIVAVQVIVLRFDPFNRSMLPMRLIAGGAAGQNMLKVGASSFAVTYDLGFDVSEYTSIAFVSDVRFSDGSRWEFSEQSVLALLKKAAPELETPSSWRPPIRKDGTR